LIPAVKIETIHHVEGLVGNEFPSMRSCGGLKSQDVEKNIFLRFVEKQPLMGKFSKFCFENIHDTDRRVVFKFREIWMTELCKIVHTVRARK